ncbi:MAG TPA: ABC transporter ATP-binding protein [Solirubrobacteraceae bacterium]|nr:ABC transporter ATP-binding protein [Solirubrobacteraceae bacterium]
MRLRLDDVHTYYGESHILQGISLEVGEGEVVALLGRNGAGKTTTMRSITGLTPAKRGSITLDGEEISRLAPHRVARHGIAYVPSGRRVFGSLTVRQNLELARRDARVQSPVWTIERVHETFPKLLVLDSRRAGLLSGGEQQMLKLARSLIAHPKLLLLDEPTEGLAPVVVGEMRDWIELIKQERGMSILLSEQNALFALHLADRGYILEKGRIQHQATAAELAGSSEVRTYLGVQERGVRRRQPARIPHDG